MIFQFSETLKWPISYLLFKYGSLKVLDTHMSPTVTNLMGNKLALGHRGLRLDIRYRQTTYWTG